MKPQHIGGVKLAPEVLESLPDATPEQIRDIELQLKIDEQHALEHWYFIHTEFDIPDDGSE